MTSPEPGGQALPRARVAEARRNRQSLVAAATELFSAATAGPVPLDAIARQAGVGIGTLYRHFPTREALVVTVYEAQVDQLRVSAERLVAERTPALALRAWLAVFADWAATKHGMLDSLRALMADGRLDGGQMREHLVASVGLILRAGVEAGEFRPDVTAADFAALLAGALSVTGGDDRRARTQRLLDLVADVLRRVE